MATMITKYEVFDMSNEAETIVSFLTEAAAIKRVARMTALGYGVDYEAVQVERVAPRTPSPCYCDSAYHPFGH